MVRKCDSAKYKKRRQKERRNKIGREHRLRIQEALRSEQIREQKRRAEAARLADPRRQLVQRLVNILYSRVSSDPVYQVIMVGKLFGVGFPEGGVYVKGFQGNSRLDRLS